MISIDPETDYLIKEANRQRREVERGRLKLEDATALPEGTRLESGRVVMPGETFFSVLGLIILAPVTALIAFWAIDGLFNFAASQYARPTLASYILLPIIALILGSCFYWIRDRLNLPAYAVVEIGIGMATAAQFARDGEALVRVLAFLAGTRTIVDGISRLLRFTGLVRNQAQK